MNEYDESSAIADTPGRQVIPKPLAGYILGHDTRGFWVGANVDDMLHRIRWLQEALIPLKDCMEADFHFFAINELRILSHFVGNAENKKVLEQCHVAGASGCGRRPYGDALWNWPSIDQELYQVYNYRSLDDFGNDRIVFNCYRLGMFIAAGEIKARDYHASKAILSKLSLLINDRPLGPLTNVKEFHAVMDIDFYWYEGNPFIDYHRSILRAIFPEDEEFPSSFSAAMLGAMQSLDKSVRRALSQGHPLYAALASQESDTGEKPSRQHPGLHSLDDQSARMFPITQSPEYAEPSPSPPDNNAIGASLVHSPDEPRPKHFHKDPIHGRVKDVVQAVLGRKKEKPLLRDLETLAKKGAIWIVRYSQQDVAVYFKYKDKYDQAIKQFDDQK